MESCNILSTVTAGEDRTLELRYLVKPSVAPPLYDSDVAMNIIITSSGGGDSDGGENEHENNNGGPTPTDNSFTDYSISSSINVDSSIISNDDDDDDASEEYSVSSSPQQLTTSAAAGISFLCIFMANIQGQLDFHGHAWDHILTSSF